MLTRAHNCRGYGCSACRRLDWAADNREALREYSIQWQRRYPLWWRLLWIFGLVETDRQKSQRREKMQRGEACSC